jgi:hypothetical protein
LPAVIYIGFVANMQEVSPQQTAGILPGIETLLPALAGAALAASPRAFLELQAAE